VCSPSHHQSHFPFMVSRRPRLGQTQGGLYEVPSGSAFGVSIPIWFPDAVSVLHRIPQGFSEPSVAVISGPWLCNNSHWGATASAIHRKLLARMYLWC
jgi:hypothetical protein